MYENSTNQSSANKLKRIDELIKENYKESEKNNEKEKKSITDSFDEGMGIYNGLRSDKGMERAQSIAKIVALCCG